MSSEPFWVPGDEEMRNARMSKFREFANAHYGRHMSDYWDLYHWSIGTPEEMNEFWTALWDWSGILGDKGPAPVSREGH